MKANNLFDQEVYISTYTHPLMIIHSISKDTCYPNECEIPQKDNLFSLRNGHLFSGDLFSTLIFEHILK